MSNYQKRRAARKQSSSSSKSSSSSPPSSPASLESSLTPPEPSPTPSGPSYSSVAPASQPPSSSLALNPTPSPQPMEENIDLINDSSEENNDSDEDINFIFSDDEMLSDSDLLSSDDEGVPELKEFCMTHLNDGPTNGLLNILREKFHLEKVPKNVGELYGTLSTPMPDPVPIEGGHYLHMGIKNNLKYVDCHLTHLTLNFSWDGVRLFKSSKTNIWPLVMAIEELPDIDVMLVGVFIGESKPNNPDEFFYCFNKEVMEIADSQYIVEVGPHKKRCTVSNSYMIADTPAKTWALGMYYTF